MQKIKLKINGMHCVSCAMNIDGDLEDTEGVTKLQSEQIIKIIEKTGYGAQALHEN